MNLGLFGHQRSIVLGVYGSPLVRRTLRLPIDRARSHMHVIGVSDSGKSRFLAGLYVSYLEQGLPATLIDPHGDLARLVLMLLVARGVYERPEGFERILYLDLPGAERQNLYAPLNVLARPGKPQTIAAQTMEAFHRAYPELAAGAPRFDKLIQHGVKVLISNKLPLPMLPALLTNKPFRDSLLTNEDDADIVSLWRDWYDRLSDTYRHEYIDSTISRIQLLTFHPALKHSLGQDDLLFDFRRIMDSHQAAIINLSLDDPEARRLVGCLLTVLAEYGALSRSELPAETRFGFHLLMIDEFPEFSTHSGEALSRMLSQTRKFGLYSALCHQNLGQLNARLLTALQNVGIVVAFGVGRDDAEELTKVFGRVEPKTVRQDVREEQLSESVGMREQWEGITQGLHEQWQRDAYVAIHNRRPLAFPWRHLLKQSPRRVVKVKTPKVVYPSLPAGRLAEVEAEYLRRYFRGPRDTTAGAHGLVRGFHDAPRRRVPVNGR